MPDQQNEVEAIFMEALDKDSAAERAAYLDEACGDNSELHNQVEALIRAHNDAGSFLEKPPAGLQGTTATKPGSGDAVDVAEEEVSLDFLSPCDKPDRLGTLGQYEIMELIGRGGMGVVLKGLDTKLNRIVAIKVLSPALASNAVASSRFLREAQAAAAVSHDHVVRIYAVDDSTNVPFLVMECIDGQSLQRKIDGEGTLKLNELLRVGMQAAAGLAAAHNQGLVHRDIKPSNILLENGIERVKVTDFGLARAVDDIGVTQTGQIAGTPQYMSPEQAQGDAVDHRSDLFSLGSVLYAMCTGRAAFRADSTMAVLRRVCDNTPRPIREVTPDIPEWLIEIIDRLLEKNPDRRFQTADEVAELLGRHLAQLQHPTHTPPPGVLRKHARRSVGRRWAAAAAALLLVSVGLSVTEVTGVTNVAATVIRIVTGEGTLIVEVDDPTVNVSIDGTDVSISGAGAEEVTLRPGRYKVSASKDGKPLKQELVNITRGGRRVVRVTLEPRGSAATAGLPSAAAPPASKAGGGFSLLRRLEGHTDRVSCVAISPDGQRALSSSADGTLRLWNLETGELLRTVDMRGYARSIAFSADGLYVTTGGVEVGRVRLWDLDSMHVIRRFEGHTDNVYAVRLTPNGKRLLTASSDGTARYWNVQTGQEIFRFCVENGHDYGAAITSDGLHAVVCPRRRSRLTIHICNLQTGEVEKTIDKAAEELVGGQVSLSPDGRYVVVPTGSGRIVRCDLKTEAVRWLRQHDGPCRSALFLSDSRHVVSCGSDGTISLWNSETGRELSRTRAHIQGAFELALSADGRRLLSAPGWLGERNGAIEADPALKLWRLSETVSPARLPAP